MESKETKEKLPSSSKRDFFITENQKEIENILTIRTKKGTKYENLIYPNTDIREISTRKNNKLLIDADIINQNEEGKYIELNGEKFYELIKGSKRKIGKYFYIDTNKKRNGVFHIGRITGFEEIYNKKYAIRNGQSMRIDGSIHTGNTVIDVE